MNKKILLLFLTTVLIFSSAGCFGSGASSSARASLTFYGLDDKDVFDPLIAQYKRTHPSVTVKYKKFNDPAGFENLVVNEIAEGEGPDIFYIHDTWLPRHTKKLVPLQSQSLTNDVYSQVYVNVVSQDFIQPDPRDGARKIYAVPLYVDTLALYYNKNDFEQRLPERGRPAGTWQVLKDDSEKFRQQDEQGHLTHGQIALGRSDNIKLAVDILYNLFLQNGVDLYSPDFKRVQLSGKAEDMLEYFLSFAVYQNRNYSWSADLTPAGAQLKEVEAFLAGKTSVIAGYSDLYQRLDTYIRNVASRNSSSAISKNDIGVAKMPQFSAEQRDYKVLADYYGLAVSRNSKNAAAAWDFIQFLGSKDNSKSYHAKTKRPTARRDLIEDQKKEPITEIFVSQLGYAASYRIFDDQRFARIFEEGVNAVNNGQSISSEMNSIQTKLNELLTAEAPNGLYPALPARK